MTSLEVKLSISGAELLALQKLAGTVDDLVRLRSTARTIVKTTLINAAAAAESCLNGMAGDIEIAESSIDEQKEL